MKAKLIALQAALKRGDMHQIATAYRTVESTATAPYVPPFTLSKPLLMQIMRKQLMKEFGPEIMRVGTNITPKALAEYDIDAELANVIEKIEEG